MTGCIVASCFAIWTTTKYHYAHYIERVEMPRSGNMQSFQKRHDIYYIFDSHHALAKSYVQVLRRIPKTVQNVGPQCKRADVNGGEDNAIYIYIYIYSILPLFVRAVHGSPRVCEPFDVPAVALSTNRRHRQIFGDATEHASFEAGANTIRPSVESSPLRDRGPCRSSCIQAQQRYAHWCDSRHDFFKGLRIRRKFLERGAGKATQHVVEDRATDDATEHGFEIKLLQVLIQQAVRQTMGQGACQERVMHKLMECLDIPTPWHPDQPLS